MFRNTSVSKPLQLALMLGTSMTAIAMLKPQPVLQAAAAPRRVPATAVEQAQADTGMPWVRADVGAWQGPADAPADKPLPGPARLRSIEVASPPQPALDGSPAVPDPAVRYVGRMEREGRWYAFFANGEIPAVVEVGGQVDRDWKLVGVTEQQAELLYVPLNASRFIAMP